VSRAVGAHLGSFVQITSVTHAHWIREAPFRHGLFLRWTFAAINVTTSTAVVLRWLLEAAWCCHFCQLTRRRTRLKVRLQARQSGLDSSASHGALMSWISLRTCGRNIGTISSYDLPWQPWLMVSITQLSLPSRN